MLRKHLHDKVLSILFLVGIVPLVILGALALFNLNLFHQVDVASIENNLIDQKIEEIRAFVEGIISTFQLKIGQEIGEIEVVDQRFFLKQLLGEFPDLEEVSFIGLDGEETSSFSRSFPDGLPEDELFDHSNLEKFIKAKSGQNYIGGVYFTLQGPMITISAPVLNKNDQIIQVLTGEVRLENLKKIIEKSKLGNTGYVYVTDKDGFLIASSRTEKDTLASLRSVEFVHALLEGVEDGDVPNRYTNFWGELVVAEGKYLSDLGFAVIAEWPVQDADKIVSTVRNQIVVTSVLVVAATLLLGILFTNKIVRPIKTLEKGTQMIAEGKFGQQINIKTGDEIEELGVAFNNMTAGLKRLQELKNEFVFIAAHELRTPLTGIKGFLSLLKDETGNTLTERSKEYIARSLGASDRLARLVNEILEIARSEAGRIKIEVSPQDLTESVKTILAEVKTLADQKKIGLSYSEFPGLPEVLADPSKLKEVITNFVSNAIKYNNEGGWVKVSHEVNGKEVITHFEDNGFGISEKEQKQLFQKFFRADIGRIKSIEGTGLGLFITKELIEKMEGRVWFKSQEGKGTTFSFALRRA